MGAGDETYTLADLEDWRRPGIWLAVVGDPIDHSLSPPMHNAALAELAGNDSRFAAWRYVRFRIASDALPKALPAFHAAGFRGLNLTIPHKVRAFSLVEEVAVEARALGAVNTLLRTRTGYAGTNTDGFGIARALGEVFGKGFAGAQVVLLGAGGAARSVAVQAVRDGAEQVWIGNRSADRLDALMAALKNAGMEAKVRPFLFDEPPDALPRSAMIVNATAAGLRTSDPLPFGLERFSASSFFYDTTYGVKNAWAVACAERGIAYADGLSMLVWQGVRSLELWTERPVQADIMEAAARRALVSR